MFAQIIFLWKTGKKLVETGKKLVETGKKLVETGKKLVEKPSAKKILIYKLVNKKSLYV